MVNPNSMAGYLSPKEVRKLRDQLAADKWLSTFFGFLAGALGTIIAYNL